MSQLGDLSRWERLRIAGTHLCKGLIMSTARFEGDHEHVIDLFRTSRNNARLMGSHSEEDSSVGMPDLTQGNEEQNSDEDSSEGIPDLIDHHDDSSEEDTVEFSVDSSDITSDTDSVITVDEGSSGEKSSVGTNESSVIQIDNLKLVREDLPEQRTCFTCAMNDHGRSGHTTEACTDRRPRVASEIPGQYIAYRVVITNELRRVGIDRPVDLRVQSDQESANEEEPELGLVSQQSFPTSSLSLL